MTDAVSGRLENENTNVVWIPGGLTSQLQPLDASMNKPLKDAVRTMWMEWMMDEQSHQYTPTGRLKRPSITAVCQWIKNAWEGINPQLMIKSFKKCCISNALDGTEDDLIYEDDDDHPFAFADENVNDNEDCVSDFLEFED